LGNISDTPLAELVDLPRQRKFGEDKLNLLPQQCRSCDCLALCGGGCPKDRFSPPGGGEPGVNYLCGGLRRFFTHAKQPLTQIIELSRNKMTPENIMYQLNYEAARKWKNVGRNSPCPCGSGRKAKNCCMQK
jgi:uncharacterized protein